MSKYYTLKESTAFNPQLEITPGNFSSFSRYLKPDEDIKVEIKDLPSQDKKFALSALCGYHRFYRQRKALVKKGSNFYQLESYAVITGFIAREKHW